VVWIKEKYVTGKEFVEAEEAHEKAELAKEAEEKEAL